MCTALYVYHTIGFNGSLSSHDETAYHVINLSSVNITCAEGYYLSESGVCRPLCSHWVGSAEIKSDYVFIAAIASALIGLVSSTILIIIAFTLQRKTLYVVHSDYCCKSDLQIFATHYAG